MNNYVQCSRFVTLTKVRYKKCKYSQEKGVFSEERRGNICYCVYVQSDGYVDGIICILMCGHDWRVQSSHFCCGQGHNDGH